MLSPTSRSLCYPTTSASVSLSSFPRHLHHHHSLSCPHIILLVSIQAHTISPYFPVLSWIFSHIRCPSNYFIPISVQLGDSTQPSKHPLYRHIQLDASKQLFAQDCRTIDALTPNRAALIQHARGLTIELVTAVVMQMMIAAPERPPPSELLRCSCKKGCGMQCRCLKAALQCAVLCYCIGLCAHD